LTTSPTKRKFIQPTVRAAMKRAISIALAALLSVAVIEAPLAASIYSAPAAENRFAPTEQETVIVIRGMIELGSFQAFWAAAATGTPDIVILESLGGLIDDAIWIAREIRSHGMNTVIYGARNCVSACALMFLSGRMKYVYGASIGVHAASYAGTSPSIEGTIAMARYLTVIDVVARMSGTSYWDMHWLSERDRERLGVVTLVEKFSGPANLISDNQSILHCVGCTSRFGPTH
jgi:hypothetical protein